MTKGLLYSVISAICFGIMAPLAKVGFQAGLTEMTELQYRFNFGVAFLFLFLLLKCPAQLKAGLPTLLKTAFLGMVVSVVQSTCFFRAAMYIPASTTALIFYLYPVTVTLLSMVFLRLRPDRTTGWSLLLVTGGCGLVFYDAFLREVAMIGVVYALGAMSFFSVYLILVQVLLRDERPLTATFYCLAFAAISFNILGGLNTDTPWSADRFFIGCALGLVCTAIAVSLLYVAVELIGSAMVSIFSTFEPIATLTAAHLMLGESVNGLQLFGAAFIIIGIILPNARLLRLRKQQVESGPQPNLPAITQG